MRGGTSSAQFLDILVVPGGCPDRDIPMLLAVILATDINMGPCHCVVIGPDMALSGSMVWDFIMASDDKAGYSQQAIYSSRHWSPVPSFSLHNPQMVLVLFLSHLSATYLHIVVASATAWSYGWQPSGWTSLSRPHGVVASVYSPPLWDDNR